MLIPQDGKTTSRNIYKHGYNLYGGENSLFEYLEMLSEYQIYYKNKYDFKNCMKLILTKRFFRVSIRM